MLLFIFLPLSSLAEAKKTEKVAVFYSYKNVEYHKDQKKDFDSIWTNVVKALNETYLSPQYLTNIDDYTDPAQTSIDLIIFPLALDISKAEEIYLTNYLAKGGKLVISTGNGEISGRLKKFLNDNGVFVKDNYECRNNLKLNHSDNSLTYELPVGSYYSKFKKTNIFSSTAGRWSNTNEDSIINVKNIVYLGYPWGQDSISKNEADVLLKTLNYYWKGFSKDYEQEISQEEYDELYKEITALKNSSQKIVELSEKLIFNVPKDELKNHFNEGDVYFKGFVDNFIAGDFSIARTNAFLAKKEFSRVTSLGIPTKNVEVRAIWLDRGTIVNCSGPNELRDMIKALAEVGFNVIFFETVNAGYPIYPSALLPQNPLVKGWDPLKVAIKEAHENNIELHAWVWTFAVGNKKHNLIINAPEDYAGPIVTAKPEWGMRTNEDSLLINDLPEIWVSPANQDARKFLLGLFKEIVTNYEVDGLQLDYIRFPFQKNNQQYGFDPISTKAYFDETGLKPAIEGEENIKWKNWKTDKVTSFVREASFELKKIKPDLKLSVGVFAMQREKRISGIQQDWETWALNKWVDLVCPFYYSYSPRVVSAKLNRSNEITMGMALIIPGFNIRTIDEGKLSELIIASREAGTLGIALFAVAHLDKDKASVLDEGPFREKAYLPYKDSTGNVKRLFEEFSQSLNSYINESSSVLSDQDTKNQVSLLINSIESSLGQNNFDNLDKDLLSLITKMNDLTRLDRYVDDTKDNNADYLKSGLERIRNLYQYSIPQ